MSNNSRNLEFARNILKITTPILICFLLVISLQKAGLTSFAIVISILCSLAMTFVFLYVNIGIGRQLVYARHDMARYRLFKVMVDNLSCCNSFVCIHVGEGVSGSISHNGEDKLIFPMRGDYIISCVLDHGIYLMKYAVDLGKKSKIEYSYDFKIGPGEATLFALSREPVSVDETDFGLDLQSRVPTRFGSFNL